jgi:DNA-binding XRE family transcriptional regulator
MKKKRRRVNRKLRNARVALMLSIEEAAQMVGVATITFQRWELRQQDPQISSLRMLCQSFGKTPKELGYGL